MLNINLASSFGIKPDAVPQARIVEISDLASQTFLQERESLYAASRYAYSGEGSIWDIGCAAGGSSFCLAAGLQDREDTQSHGQVECFDIFNGHSVKAFKRNFLDLPDNVSDLDIFLAQTSSVRDFVKPVVMDIITDLDTYKNHRPVELAHIDIAKSLELWISVFKKLSTAVIPGKTIWIFQDFSRARLPWQIYSLGEILSFGEIIGGAIYGTAYFRFNSEISDEVRAKIINDDFSIEERVRNVRLVLSVVKASCMSFFPEKHTNIHDFENTALAYCYFWQNNKEKAQYMLKNVSEDYLLRPANLVYSREILQGVAVSWDGGLPASES